MKLYFGKTSEEGERSHCMVKLQKSGFAVKLVVTFVWYGVSVKLVYLCFA